VLRNLPADTDLAPLALQHGRFVLRRDARGEADRHFADWYTRHAQPWIERRVALLAPRVEATPTSVQVRDLGFRWGSCGRNGRLNFHWRAILLPPRIIGYLIAHELVHLREAHHTQEFWRRLERVIPDFAQRKQWLSEHGGAFT
jgi:predicted metal-dependent hydrolase